MDAGQIISLKQEISMVTSYSRLNLKNPAYYEVMVKADPLVRTYFVPKTINKIHALN